METPFLLDFEVESHGCLPADLKQIVSLHPRGQYTIFVENLRTDPGADRPILAMQVVVQAPDILAAKDIGKRSMSEYLDILTFITNLKFEIHKLGPRRTEWVRSGLLSGRRAA